MKLRRTLISTALAVAATLGMTVPFAAPASAASCTEVQGASGSSAFPSYRSTEIDVSSSLSIGVANCAGWRYRYTVFVFDTNQTIYGSSSVSGTTSFGAAFPPTIHTSGLPYGKTEVAFGYKTEIYDLNTGTWTGGHRGAWYITIPGSFQTSTGQNSRGYPYHETSSGSPDCPIIGYTQPCLPLPF